MSDMNETTNADPTSRHIVIPGQSATLDGRNRKFLWIISNLGEASLGMTISGGGGHLGGSGMLIGVIAPENGGTAGLESAG